MKRMIQQLSLSVLVAASLVAGSAIAADTMTVYKSPTCGCCSRWITYLEKQGFLIQAEDMEDVSGVKVQLGVPKSVYACHTAVIDGYVIEGHVPVEDIQRLLDERPALSGIGVADMPLGSPGMDGPDRVPEPYEVLSFDAAGQTSVYARH